MSTPDEIAAEIISGAVDLHVIVGPCVWQPSDGASARRWYFTVATKAHDGPLITSMTVDGDSAEAGRAAFIAALLQRRPCVIHDMGDELSMAKLCATIWPCQRMSKLVREIAKEKAKAQ